MNIINKLNNKTLKYIRQTTFDRYNEYWTEEQREKLTPYIKITYTHEQKQEYVKKSRNSI